VLTLGGGVKNDMVGIYMTAESMRRAIPLLKEENVGIVVLRVNSGGGYTFEVPRLSDVIEFEYKKNFQTVGWIESAISAAAMTASTIEDIYFMPEGHMGAATEFSGAGVATKGRQLEETLFKMENIVTRGKHPMEIMRAMQILVPLSANINPVTGEVAFFQNLEGELILNPENRILTLNAETAAKIRFSRGTAANVDELGKLMGYSELTWVGERVAGVPYPVSKAEKYMRGFREQTGEDERRLREYQTLYGESIQRAQGATAETRGLFIGKARDALSKVRRMVDNNPNFAFFIFGMTPPQWKEWLQEQDEMLRRLGTPPRR
jgi:hypothetical protein